MMIYRNSALIAAVFSVFATTAIGQDSCVQTSEGRVCSFRPEVANGVLVPIATQQALGLVTVAGGCSGTLLNRFWVLTADHCITTDGKMKGPAAPFANAAVTSAWSTRRVIPTRYVRFSRQPGTDLDIDFLDVALLFLGAGDFGSVNAQPLFNGTVVGTSILIKYGQGLSTFAVDATPGPPPTPPVPGVADGRYRSSQFTPPGGSTPTMYRLWSNAQNQVGHGGDSGCPDFVIENGVTVGIAGVQSTCLASGIVASMIPTPPPTPYPWQWVTNISYCESASLSLIRDSIRQIIREGIIPCQGVSAGCAVSEVASLLLN